MVNHPLAKGLGAAVCMLVVALSGCGQGVEALEGGAAPEVAAPVPRAEIDPDVVVPIPIAHPPAGAPVSLPVTTATPPSEVGPQIPSIPSVPPACNAVFVDRQLGGGLDDAITAMTIDRQELYLAGHVDGTRSAQGITGQTPALFHVDAWGRPEALKGFNSAGLERIEDLILHRDELVIAGRTLASADAFVAVIPHHGTGPQTFLQVGASEPGAPHQVAIDRHGGWLMSGFVQNTTTDPMLAFGYLPSSGGSLSLGAIEIQRTDTVDRYVGVAATHDGTDDIFVVGERRWEPARGVFVRRLTRTGALKWEQNVAAGENDRAGKMISLPNGDLVVVGTTSTELTKQYGGKDAFIARLDGGNGRIIQFGQAGTENDDFATQVFVDIYGHVFIAGHSVVWNQAGERSTDAFVHEFDLDGNWIHEWYGRTEGRDEATAVVRDACDRILVAGTTAGSLAGPNLGGLDGFVMQISLGPATH